MSGLPIAGALLGGPIVGAALFVAERLIKELGPDIDEASGIVYTVTGTWEDPKIKLITPPQQKPQAQRNFPYNLR